MASYAHMSAVFRQFLRCACRGGPCLAIAIVVSALSAAAAPLLRISLQGGVLSEPEAKVAFDRTADFLDWPPTSAEGRLGCEVFHGVGFRQLRFEGTSTRTSRDAAGRRVDWTCTVRANVLEFGLPFTAFLVPESPLMLPATGLRDRLRLATDFAIWQGTRVRPSGLVLNILFFWSVSLGMRPVLQRVRRAYRQIRGCCPNCGHPRCISSRCSECGERGLPRDPSHCSKPV